jgi:hypothetical protein
LPKDGKIIRRVQKMWFRRYENYHSVYCTVYLDRSCLIIIIMTPESASTNFGKTLMMSLVDDMMSSNWITCMDSIWKCWLCHASKMPNRMLLAGKASFCWIVCDKTLTILKLLPLVNTPIHTQTHTHTHTHTHMYKTHTYNCIWTSFCFENLHFAQKIWEHTVYM